MPAWNELHYARAQEFARIIAEAATGQANTLTNAAPPISPPPAPAPAPALRPPAPAAAAPVAPTPPAPAKPTAASVFNKIPWKK